MDWEIEGHPLLEAVARAIEENDGDHGSPQMVNAQLDPPSRRLGSIACWAISSTVN